MDNFWYILLFCIFFLQWALAYLSPWRRISRKNSWKLSFAHSVVTFIGSIVALWQTQDTDWFDVKNEETKTSVLLVSWSLAYFICDFVAGYLDEGVTVYAFHHVLVIICYSVTLAYGHSIKGIMYHLFYSEMGNICYGARNIGLFGINHLQQGIGDSTFLFFNRVAWLVHFSTIGLAPMLQPSFRTWDLHDYFAFYGSLFLLLGDGIFALLLFKFVMKKLSENSSSGISSLSAISSSPKEASSRKSKNKVGWQSSVVEAVKAFGVNFIVALRTD